MKKGQVWIETVLYTLIGLSLVGITLAFLTPKINDMRDKAVIEQTMNLLSALDEKVNSVLSAPGNTRIIDFTIKKGNLYVNSSGEEIYFIIDGLSKPYSQENVEIEMGRINLTSFKGRTNSVKLKLNYVGRIDLTYNGQNEETVKKFSPASVPYKFYLENKGALQVGGLNVVDIR